MTNVLFSLDLELLVAGSVSDVFQLASLEGGRRRLLHHGEILLRDIQIYRRSFLLLRLNIFHQCVISHQFPNQINLVPGNGDTFYAPY